jgi:hypothetical protein
MAAAAPLLEPSVVSVMEANDGLPYVTCLRTSNARRLHARPRGVFGPLVFAEDSDTKRVRRMPGRGDVRGRAEIYGVARYGAARYGVAQGNDPTRLEGVVLLSSLNSFDDIFFFIEPEEDVFEEWVGGFLYNIITKKWLCDIAPPNPRGLVLPALARVNLATNTYEHVTLAEVLASDAAVHKIRRDLGV